MDQNAPDPLSRDAIIAEFADLHVSSSALEEALGIDMYSLTEEDMTRLRRICAYMKYDRLTLSRAIMAATRGTRVSRPRQSSPTRRQKKSETTRAIKRSETKVVAKEAVPAEASEKAKTLKKRSTTTRRIGKSGNLLIVESPAKAKTIKKFLGADYTVKASMGHVRDIPTRGRGRADIGIDFQNRYQPDYLPIESREKVLKELSTAAEKAAHVYLAPDPDREGEAIAWHLREALGLSEDKTSRVTFNAITRSAVQEAMQHPTRINMDLVNAQQGRRVLDRIVGYKLSPFLWKKVTKGLSAGRVQSVAVRMVTEREREIQAFRAVEFWRLVAELSAVGSTTAFQAELVSWEGKPFILGGDKKPPTAPDEKTARQLAENLDKKKFSVREVTEREVKGRPSPPFITSTLQQAASTFLHFGAQKTMRLAQQLYEGVELQGGQATGLITYMRTDSTRLAPEALGEARDFIGKNYSPAYLPEKAQVYSSRKGAQDAHEAIRPTSAFLTPDSVRTFLTPEQAKLYDLIWRRFIASQMAPAVYQTTTALIVAGEGEFEAKGRRVVFDGHSVLGLGAMRKKKEKKEDGEDGEEERDTDEEQALPPLADGQALDNKGISPSQHFTQPPPRYSEASLVRALEKEGIGRPSTYAPIVQTIQDRGYVRQENRRFHATQLGLVVTDILTENFPDVMDMKFTAQMENDLDSVEDGKADWVELVDKFYKPFEKKLQTAMQSSATLKGAPAPNGETCPQCQGPMTIRFSQRGAFLGCAKYPDCSGTRPMPGEDGSDPEGEGGDTGEVCSACGSPMVRKRSRFGQFLACSNYPDCRQTKPIGKDGKAVTVPDIKCDCEKCGKPMTVKMGRRGPFLACSGYPECRNTKHIDKNGNVVDLPDAGGAVCPKCSSPMVTRMSRRGPFLACSAFPKCRHAEPLPKDGTKPPESSGVSAPPPASLL